MSSIFPREIIIEILKRLPVKPVTQFRCVCKNWCNLLNDLEFLKEQQKHILENDNSILILRKGRDYYSISNDRFTSLSSSSSPSDVGISLSAKNVKILRFPIISPEDSVAVYYVKRWGEVVKILGSCEGLILFFLNVAGFYGLFNPYTGEYKILPGPRSSIPPNKSVYISYGFGYDFKNKDHKLVRIAKSDDNVFEVKVYALSSNSWRSLENLDFQYVSCRGTPMFLNGSLHWIAIRCFGTPQLILSFDLGYETFKELALPEKLEAASDIYFSVVGGCLAILCNSPWGQFDAWVMKNYGVRQSWTKLFTITRTIEPSKYIFRSFRCLRRMVCLKNGEFLLEFQLEQEKRADLVVYDPTTERAKVLNVPKKRWYKKPRLPDGLLFRSETYVESLVSLNSGTYVGM